MIARRGMMKTLTAGAAALVTLLRNAASAQPAAASSLKSKVLISKPLEELKGKDITGTIVELEYVPGGASTHHRHPGPVFVYVLEGSLLSQSEGGSPIVYTKGQTFYEPPGSIHMVSKNASATDPAKFLAIFVSETGKPLTVPAE
jgi:quercetin dioxygenase-like cupin family protein